MDISIANKDTEAAYSTPIVQQTSFWSDVKKRMGLESRAFEFAVRNSDIYTGVGGWSVTHADFILFLQHINDRDYVAYVPYGPETEPSEENQGRFLEELSETVRPMLPKGCVALRYDLNWQSHWCRKEDFDCQGNWRGEPRRECQEIQLNYGTANHNLRKANSNILPTNTIVIDIRQSEEAILARMKPKTRYNIRHALRLGVEVRQEGIGSLDKWYSLYKETAIRNGLHLNSIDYFRSLFAPKIGKDEDDDVRVRLLIAYYAGTPLSAMFLINSAHRATYLYGASSSSQRNTMSTYALQWHAIRTAKADGLWEYDMFGVAPGADPSHPMYGLYRFKNGFGGHAYHQLGCWDYPLDEDKYNLLAAAEIRQQGYYAR